MTVQWNGDAILAKIKAATLVSITRGTESVREEATSLILNGEKTGRIYRRRGVAHQASAPGEAPASDLGTLLRSITTSVSAEALTGNINFRTEYARRLEYGFVGLDSLGRTYDQAPRPFARPALSNKQEAIRDDVASEISDALK